ncbi:hypothetical protein CS538_05815 [Clostridium combesii]|uniref:N-acetyltransferase domain-containing protein n=1 Tax=Clostridium combesii TaxID=39481 RepID=A0A2G7HJQ0_9CLOT|nr:hypothetical protein CS538_05815 [Clostridium combesii]
MNKLTQEVVGKIGLLEETVDHEEVWGIGYILIRKYYGNGYTTKGAITMADYAFNILKAPKVVCYELSKMHKVVADNVICKGYNRRECNNSYEEIIYIICIAGGEEYK